MPETHCEDQPMKVPTSTSRVWGLSLLALGVLGLQCEDEQKPKASNVSAESVDEQGATASPTRPFDESPYLDWLQSTDPRDWPELPFFEKLTAELTEDDTLVVAPRHLSRTPDSLQVHFHGRAREKVSVDGTDTNVCKPTRERLRRFLQRSGWRSAEPESQWQRFADQQHGVSQPQLDAFRLDGDRADYRLGVYCASEKPFPPETDVRIRKVGVGLKVTVPAREFSTLSGAVDEFPRLDQMMAPDAMPSFVRQRFEAPALVSVKCRAAGWHPSESTQLDWCRYWLRPEVSPTEWIRATILRFERYGFLTDELDENPREQSIQTSQSCSHEQIYYRADAERASMRFEPMDADSPDETTPAECGRRYAADRDDKALPDEMTRVRRAPIHEKRRAHLRRIAECLVDHQEQHQGQPMTPLEWDKTNHKLELRTKSIGSERTIEAKIGAHYAQFVDDRAHGLDLRIAETLREGLKLILWCNRDPKQKGGDRCQLQVYREDQTGPIVDLTRGSPTSLFADRKAFGQAARNSVDKLYGTVLAGLSGSTQKRKHALAFLEDNTAYLYRRALKLYPLKDDACELEPPEDLPRAND